MAEFTRDSIKQLIDNKVAAFNSEHNLIQSSDRIVLACSGNMDSIFAMHYLLSKSYTFIVAHVDHMTRDGQSTKDAEFVKKEANRYNIPFFQKRIDVKSLIQDGGNFQEIARNERYAYFAELMKTHQCTKLITAHHGDDNVETLLMNLGRAGGLKAMRGILPKNGPIIRPFLCLRKKEIEAYVDCFEIDYVTDSSNYSAAYHRNYFRNEVIPIIEKKQPQWVDQAMKSMSYLAQWEKIWTNLSRDLYEHKGDVLHIKIENDNQERIDLPVLLQLLQSYGFNAAQVGEMIHCEQVGKKWETSGYWCFRERKTLDVFSKKCVNPDKQFHVGDNIPGFGYLTEEYVMKQLPSDFEQEVNKVMVRKKRDGDFMRTSSGTKKLKKIFTDKKWSNYKKMQTYVLAFEKEVFSIL